MDVVNSMLPADTEFGCHQCALILGKGNTNSSQKYCGKVHLLPKLPLLHVVQDGCEISLENECDMILFRSLHSDLR